MAHDQPARILIVEDDPGVAALMQRRLQRAGHEAAVAPGPEEALRQLEQGESSCCSWTTACPAPRAAWTSTSASRSPATTCP
jgi:DNA-binding NtrC family response regulator